MTLIKVLVADSQLMFCDALAIALQNDPGFLVLEERPHIAATAIEIAAARRPHVVLIDYWLDMEGPALTSAILKRVPRTKVIVTSWFHSSENIRESLRAGATGFLPKGLRVVNVRDAVRLAHSGESLPFGPELAGLMDRIEHKDERGAELARRLATLTPRELEVLGALRKGLRSEQIALLLGITTQTVRNHINKVLEKMGARSQLEAVIMATDGGLA